EAEAVAVRREHIVKVGSDRDVLTLRGPDTTVVELAGRLLLPGFIDAHTHFGNAAAWAFRVGLYEVREPREALERVAAAARRVPPANGELQLVGARAALEDLRRAGITSIHDVARLDDLSRRRLFHTDVERSATDLEIFRELQRCGELTVRVYAFLTLAHWREVVAAGIRP